MKFLWTNDVDLPRFPTLAANRETEVLVIGGGMAGLLCAYKLRQQGIDCIVLEKKSLGRGVTKGTTAAITAQHDILYQDLVKERGFENAKKYLTANLRAVEEYRSLASDCDFETRPSVMISQTDSQKLLREAQTVQSLGFDAKFIKDFVFPIKGAVQFDGMAQFHPLKFIAKIAKGDIYEHSEALCLKGTKAYTEQGSVRANKVIVATHFPFMNRHGMYYMKLYQKRAYVIAYENAPNIRSTSTELASQGIFMRNYGNLLLIGGGETRTGQKSGGHTMIRAFAQRYFPNAREVCAWTNQDCVSLDGLPYIGRYSLLTPNVYVATGFGLWGMTTSMVAANILCDMVQERKNPYAELFSPQRNMLTMQLASNLGTSLRHLLSPFGKRCPHMGCKLQWNAVEHSWDCACHGSQFEEDGTLIHNPAKRGLK